MKIKYVLMCLVFILIVTGGIWLMKKKKEADTIKNIENGELISLYFSYSNGYMMNANIQYEFRYDEKNNVYKVTVKPYLVADEDKVEVEVDSTLKDKLKAILVKYEVAKWDGFQKSDKYVLDGDDFSLSARFKEDISISASGYMMWPENYREVRSELDTIFMEIYNQNKGSEE